MSKVEDIKWSRQSYSLKDVLRKYTFPQILKVTAGCYSAEENESFSTGQVMRIHQLCRQTRVLASDRKGNHISIPIRYGNARFEIVNKGKKTKPMYLREIIDKSLLPREVKFAGDDDPRFRLQFANTITVEEKFNSLLLKTMYEESFIQGNAINQNLLDTQVINLPVHAKLEVAVAESFRDSPVATWDKYTNLLERLVNKHVTFRLNAGNNQITFFSDKRLEKNSTQTDIELAIPSAILYVETNLKRRPPSAGSPSSKTVGPVRTRSRSVDQLAEKPRSLGARGSKTYVNAMQREERLKKAVSTGDILKDTEKNKKNKKGSGSEKGSFSGWLLGTLTGRKKKKRPTVIENTPEGEQTPTNGVAGNKPTHETQTETKKKEVTPVVKNGRGRKATKSAEKSADKRSQSQPARQKKKANKKENSNPESSTSKGDEQTKTLIKKAGTPAPEVKTNKPKEVTQNKAKEVTKSDNLPVKAQAPSAPKAQEPSTPKEQAVATPKAQAVTTPKAQATSTTKAQATSTTKAQATSTTKAKTSPKGQGTSPRSDKSTPTQVKKTNDNNAKSKQAKQVKDANQQTEIQKTPKEKRDSSTSTTPRSILKRGNTPSISSYSSNSSADGRMEIRNDSRPENRAESRPEQINGTQKYAMQDRPAEEFYATLRKNMPVDIPVPDYKRQEMEQQRAMFAYGTTPRSPRSHINQPLNNNWQSDITTISPNQHKVDAIIHQYPEDEADMYMNADVEMYPQHIYTNGSYNGVGPPSPPPPPAFRDLNSQPPMASQPPPPPPPPIFNSQHATFFRSESEPLPQNKFSNQRARLKPVQQQSPNPKPESQTGDLMAELKKATERRKSQSDLLNINELNSPFNNGYAPRRESDAFPFNNRHQFTNGGTLQLTKRQFSSPAISYRPGPQTQPKPTRIRNPSSSSEIRNMSEVPRNLKGVNVAQISDCMRLINLEKYIETFKTHKIDGDMLVDLNKEMLKSDLGMSEIDAAKVMKFATGWRPQ